VRRRQVPEPPAHVQPRGDGHAQDASKHLRRVEEGQEGVSSRVVVSVSASGNEARADL
jgi:hypothetical protein